MSKQRSFTVTITHQYKAFDAEGARKKALAMLPNRTKVVGIQCDEVPDLALIDLSPYTLRFLDSCLEIVGDEDHPSLSYASLGFCLKTVLEWPDDGLAAILDLDDDPLGLTEGELALLVEREVNGLVRLYGDGYDAALVVGVYKENIKDQRKANDADAIARLLQEWGAS